MTDKTPGHVACEGFYDTTFSKAYSNAKEVWESAAAAVISHVRPQIEAEARAVAIKEAEDACTVPDGEGRTYTYWPCVKAIRALSTLPPTHVVVSVELLEDIRQDIEDSNNHHAFVKLKHLLAAKKQP